jgi:hypothetical protein
MESPDDLRLREVLRERLREVLEPRPETVDRIVRGALDSRPAGSARKLRLVPAAAALAVLAALGLTAVLFVGTPRPERQARISIESVGDLLVVHHREGGRWLIRNGGPAEASPPSRSLIVIYGGKP